MGGQDVVGQDLGGPGRGVEQADGALDGVGRQRRTGTGDVDELGQQQDHRVHAGRLACHGDGVASHVQADVREALLDRAQDLVARAQQLDGRQVRGQDEAARVVGVRFACRGRC